LFYRFAILIKPTERPSEQVRNEPDDPTRVVWETNVEELIRTIDKVGRGMLEARKRLLSTPLLWNIRLDHLRVRKRLIVGTSHHFGLSGCFRMFVVDDVVFFAGPFEGARRFVRALRLGGVLVFFRDLFCLFGRFALPSKVFPVLRVLMRKDLRRSVRAEN
jgi:hypothetical protein